MSDDVSRGYINVGGGLWPRPALESDEAISVEWKLRHSPANLTRADELRAASIIAAYNSIVTGSQLHARYVIRSIKDALNDELAGKRNCGSCMECASFGMIVCAKCGNKRCPKATHHDNECTNSNAPGQPGSRY